jgi:baculoviral IAP repeat-containing protein 6
MKALIFGSEGTPYAHGAFIFDIYIPEEYPNKPPTVSIVSTKGKKIRFNPNLYADGLVCLSLLGTWSGSSNENWNPNFSNIY